MKGSKKEWVEKLVEKEREIEGIWLLELGRSVERRRVRHTPILILT